MAFGGAFRHVTQSVPQPRKIADLIIKRIGAQVQLGAWQVWRSVCGEHALDIVQRKPGHFAQCNQCELGGGLRIELPPQSMPPTVQLRIWVSAATSVIAMFAPFGRGGRVVLIRLGT